MRRRTTTALGRGLIPVKTATLSKTLGLDERTIQNAANATGVDPERIRDVLLQLNDSGAASGSYTFHGPKGSGEIFWRRTTA